MRNFERINPVTLRISLYKIYHLASIIDRISNSQTPFLDIKETERVFDKISQEIYIPIFRFIDLYDLKANLILSGEVLDMIAKKSPELLNIFLDLVKKRNLSLVADAYYGDSLTCLYNSNLWAQHIQKTYKIINKIFKINPQRIFLPQIYRNLELERLLSFEKTPRFLLQNRGKRFKKEQIMLSNLRRFDGNTVSWINEENDIELNFFFVPDDMFNEVNSLIFEKNLPTVVRAFSMEIGVKYSRFLLNKTKRATKEMRKKTRINEKYSMYLYNHLQRSILRLWGYADFLISSEINNRSGKSLEFVKDVAKHFAGFADPFYLNYLDTKIFLNPKKEITRFNSPYEAYLNMQACVKNIEILLKNRL